MKRFTDRKWTKPSEKRRKSMSPRCFLDERNKKYPVKYSPTGAYYVHAIVSAARFSEMYGEKTVHQKAEKLLREYARSKKR